VELVSDYSLESELKTLQCYAPNVNWTLVAIELGYPANYTVTTANLMPYFVGNGYNVSGKIIPSSALTCNMDTDIAFLNFFIIIAVVNLISFAIIASCLTCYKFSLFTNCRVDKKKKGLPGE